MNKPLEQKHKIIIAVQLISTIALILFWGGYYIFPVLELSSPLVFIGIPHAVPVPDIFLAVLMPVAGFLIIRKRKIGIILSIIVSVILIFLGIAGFHFELSNGTILISMVSVLKSGFVNLWCIIFGLYFILKLLEKKNKREKRQ